MLERFFKCKSCSPTLVDTENTLDKSEGDQIVDNTLYRQMVGSLRCVCYTIIQGLILRHQSDLICCC